MQHLESRFDTQTPSCFLQQHCKIVVVVVVGVVVVVVVDVDVLDRYILHFFLNLLIFLHLDFKITGQRFILCFLFSLDNLFLNRLHFVVDLLVGFVHFLRFLVVFFFTYLLLSSKVNI